MMEDPSGHLTMKAARTVDQQTQQQPMPAVCFDFTANPFSPTKQSQSQSHFPRCQSALPMRPSSVDSSGVPLGRDSIRHKVPATEERGSQPQMSSTLEKLQRKGSMWASHRWQMEFCGSALTDSFSGWECWKYLDQQVEPVVKTVQLREDDIEAWLNERHPLRKEEQPSSGFKLIQINQPTTRTLNLSAKTYDSINRSFKLPPVLYHTASTLQGSCGMFVDSDGSYCKSIFLV